MTDLMYNYMAAAVVFALIGGGCYYIATTAKSFRFEKLVTFLLVTVFLASQGYKQVTSSPISKEELQTKIIALNECERLKLTGRLKDGDLINRKVLYSIKANCSQATKGFNADDVEELLRFIHSK